TWTECHSFATGQFVWDGNMLSKFWSAGGQRLALAQPSLPAPGQKGEGTIWGLATGKKPCALPERPMRAVALRPDGRWLACETGLTTILCEAGTGKRVPTLPAGCKLNKQDTWSPDGQWLLLTGGLASEGTVYEPTLGKEVLTLSRGKGYLGTSR